MNQVRTARVNTALIGSPSVVTAYFAAASGTASVQISDAVVVGRGEWLSSSAQPPLSTLSPEALIDTSSAELILVGAGARNADLALHALRRGRDVVVAPPWQIGVEQFTRLVETARVGGRRLLFSQPATSSGDVPAALRALSLGQRRPGSVRGTLVLDESPTLVELIEEAITLSRVLHGGRAETVSAAGDLHQASLHLFFSQGRTAQFQLSAGEPHRERIVTLIGSGRSWRLDLDQPHPLSRGQAAGRLSQLRPVTAASTPAPAELELEHLLRCYLADEQPLIGFDEAYDIVLGAEAARRSLLGLGAPVQTASLLETPREPAARGRPQLRSIAGGGRGSAAGARPVLRVVS
jgi:predicted dehydrogenase